MILLPATFFGGCILWSFGEYALHRWVGHNPKNQSDFADEHRTHHAQRFYFATARKKAMAVVPLVSVGLTVATFCAGAPGAALVTGFAMAYIGYEFLHRRLHTHPPRGPIGRFLRRHHFAHHFNAPQSNHGVSSPVWDMVFGTLRAPGVIRVPEKHAMVWLVDPSNGDARPEFARDYVVHHPKTRGVRRGQ
jgi:sterol desaturase/sphingolipid hydroxylase (fatty acid hydroxylase superfamily)